MVALTKSEGEFLPGASCISRESVPGDEATTGRTVQY